MLMKSLAMALLLSSATSFAATTSTTSTTSTKRAHKKMVASADATTNETTASAQSVKPDSVAAASGVNSEYFHQAEAGKLEITPAINTAVMNQNTHSTDVTGTRTTTPLSVAAEYGFTSKFALALNVSYANSNESVSCPAGENCPGSSSKGMENPTLSAKFKTAVGLGTLKAGADYKFTLEKATYDRNSRDSNMDSGGNTLTPYVAYEMPMGLGIGGVKLAYDIYKSDAQFKMTQDGAPDLTGVNTDGKALAGTLYYESSYRNFGYGAAIQYVAAESSSTKLDGQDSSSNHDGYNLLGIQFYAPIHLSATATLMPTAMIGTMNSTSSSSSVSSAGIYGIGVGCRFTL